MFDPRHTQALLAIHSEGSFQGAARALQLTPAAITQRIKALEAAVGGRVLVRGKTLRLTPAGQAIVAYHQRTQLLEEDLLRTLNLDGQSYTGRARWRTLRVAINADSMATWFLPGVAATVSRRHLLLDVVIDDQDHTHEALQSGAVMGCVTTLAEPMKGCLSEPLGIMRYRCLAHRDLLDRCQDSQGRLSVHRLLAQAAIIFNRKDALQDRFLSQHLGLKDPAYPKHFVPALDAFEAAIALGLGWGMVPEAARFIGGPGVVEVLPGATVDVALYWQHWEREAGSAQTLTRAVKQAAAQHLQPRASDSAR